MEVPEPVHFAEILEDHLQVRHSVAVINQVSFIKRFFVGSHRFSKFVVFRRTPDQGTA